MIYWESRTSKRKIVVTLPGGSTLTLQDFDPGNDYLIVPYILSAFRAAAAEYGLDPPRLVEITEKVIEP